jgi:hypothetical protein
MRYWEDMQDKYGFDDGNKEPPGADQYRAAYLMAVNALLQLHGSHNLYAPYNPPSMHNSCLVVLVTAETWDQHGQEINRGTWTPSREPVVADEQHDLALEAAHDLQVDQHVRTTIELDHEGLGMALIEVGDRMRADAREPPGLEVLITADGFRRTKGSPGLADILAPSIALDADRIVTEDGRVLKCRFTTPERVIIPGWPHNALRMNWPAGEIEGEEPDSGNLAIRVDKIRSARTSWSRESE